MVGAQVVEPVDRLALSQVLVGTQNDLLLELQELSAVHPLLSHNVLLHVLVYKQSLFQHVKAEGKLVGLYLALQLHVQILNADVGVRSDDVAALLNQRDPHLLVQLDSEEVSVLQQKQGVNGNENFGVHGRTQSIEERFLEFLQALAELLVRTLLGINNAADEQEVDVVQRIEVKGRRVSVVSLEGGVAYYAHFEVSDLHYPVASTQHQPISYCLNAGLVVELELLFVVKSLHKLTEASLYIKLRVDV